MTEIERNHIYNFLMQNAFQIRIHNLPNPLSKKNLHISDIESITYLHFWNSGIDSLIEEICLLKNLEVLKLPKNKLSFLPNNFYKLEKLKELDLSENYFSEFPEIVYKLPKLESLLLQNNRLQYLPKDIHKLEINDYYLKSWINGNDFIEPSNEIISGGKESIKIFFEELQESSQPVNEIKVLFVGDGGAGKTSLINRLISGDFNSEELKTNGIVKKRYTFDEVTANFWDFGGQTIYHSTHQFFLSKRSIYVLVLDGRKEQEEEYWLKMIENFGENSKVFVVINKIDEHHQASLNDNFLRNKYKNIVDICKISCKNENGLSDLKSKIEKEILSSEIIKEILPKNWFNTKEHLENMENDFLDYEEFERICDIYGVNPKAKKILINFLHDLGIILNFEENFKLKHTHIINPDWATEGVYNIINSEKLSEGLGLLNIHLLTDILDKNKYPCDKHLFLIELMKNFELCFEKDTNNILIPELLPKNEPNLNLKIEKPIKFRIKYDFLPKAVITRFIVKEHNLIFNNLVWRKGVVLFDSKLNTYSIIREDTIEKRVDIVVFGQYKRELLSAIRLTFDKINENFKSNKILKKILLPDNEEIEVDFNHLLKMENLGENDFFPEGADKKYQISELLDGFIKKEERGIYVKNYINGDNYENITQNNDSSGSIGGKNIQHKTNNISKELLSLIEILKTSELDNKIEIIEELETNTGNSTKIQEILGTLMTRGAEVATILPYIISVMQNLPFK
jgi:internalin A